LKKLLLRIALVFALIAAPASSAATARADSASPSTTVPADTASSLDLLPHKMVGFYVPDVPYDMTGLNNVQAEVGFPAAFSNYFQNVTDPGLAKASAANLVAQGTVPLITLEFYNPSKDSVNQPAYSLKNIANGACDTYLHKFAKDAKVFGHTIWLRPFHEMNGNWYPWCGTVNGNSPSDFAPAWRHVHDIFAAEGATNVKFVWCPNIDCHDANHSMTNPANTISSYWPGEAYVDMVALDGYNFGTSDDGTWRSFSTLFSAPYAEVCRLSSDKPILVAETSCAIAGGDKAAWIRNAFASASASFPRIVGMGWFDTNADRDWRIDSSAATLQAFKDATRNSTWSDKAATSVSIKRSASKAKLRHAFTLSGRLTPSKAGDRVRVYVRRKGSSHWAYAWATCNAGGAWRYRAKPSKRGTYSYYARFSTATTRWGSQSKTTSVVVH